MIDTEEYEGIILFDGCDCAIIGTGVNERGVDIFIYSYDKLVEHFGNEFGNEPDGIEWVNFNIVGAKVENGPMILYGIEE